MPVMSLASWYKKAILGILVIIVSAGATVLVLRSWRQPQTQSDNLVAQAIVDQTQDLPPLSVSNATLGEATPLDQARIQTAMTSFLGGRGVEAEYGINQYQAQWQVRVEDGSLSPISAEVFVPVSNDPSQRFPVVVYGAGTTGLDDSCAPSREDQSNPALGNYVNQMISMAAQGMIVVLPNYEGLDNPSRIHYYFNADSEARTLLSAAEVVVAQDSLPIKDDQIFFGGYSQGGHAAFAAVDRATRYTPGLKVSGVFGHGPTTDTTDLLRNNPNLALYFVYAYKAYYANFESERILQDRWLNRLTQANTLCVDEAFATNSARGASMYQEDFWIALQDDSLNANYAEVDKILNQNDGGKLYTGVPTLILQGTTDPIVTLDDQNEFVDSLCQRRVPVILKEYDGVHHFETRQESFSDTFDWIRAVSEGQVPESTCT